MDSDWLRHINGVSRLVVIFKTMWMRISKYR